MKSKSYDYGFQYEDNSIEKVLKIKESKDPEESFELKVEHVFMQFSNEVYNVISTNQNFSWDEIQKVLLKNILWKFNNTQAAKLTGICVRTIRNKRREYGLR